MTRQLRVSEIPALRLKLLKEQRHICPLCKKRIEYDQAALDHDHSTGHVRAVLHKQCNGVEGRVLNWTVRVGRTDPVSYLKNLIKYWANDYTANHIHPNHGKPKRRRRRRKT